MVSGVGRNTVSPWWAIDVLYRTIYALYPRKVEENQRYPDATESSQPALHKSRIYASYKEGHTNTESRTRQETDMKLKYNDWYFRYRIREYEFGVRFDILSEMSNNVGMDLKNEK